MTYHPIIGILIFLIAIIFSFFLGKNAFKKYKSKSHNSHLQGMNPNKKLVALQKEMRLLRMLLG